MEQYPNTSERLKTPKGMPVSLAVDLGPSVNRLEGGCRDRSSQFDASPLVSIVIVVYCDRAEVEALIENVMAFRCKDLEVIIVDGASNDGTVEVLASNSDYIDYWLSEPDNGIYAAKLDLLSPAKEP